MKVSPVSICGGSGTRLWPLSSPSEPKQFKPLASHQSMLKDTLDRA
ncbi:sugar phosphate nucleotidyltransferase [Woodsholea maritima]